MIYIVIARTQYVGFEVVGYYTNTKDAQDFCDVNNKLRSNRPTYSEYLSDFAIFRRLLQEWIDSFDDNLKKYKHRSAFEAIPVEDLKNYYP